MPLFIKKKTFNSKSKVVLWFKEKSLQKCKKIDKNERNQRTSQKSKREQHEI